MSRFISVDRSTEYLLPPSAQDWLPENHLARFVVDVVERLDLRVLIKAYAGRGKDAHHPAVLLGLLIYGYATGVYHSRKIERATYESLAFRYIAANTHPDHDTIAHFRARFATEISALFVQVLLVAREMKLMKLGALTGNWCEEHLFLLQQALAIYDDLGCRVLECDAKIEALLQPLARFDAPLSGTPKRRTKNNPAFDVRQAMANWTGVDLTRIDGMGVTSVMKLLAEIGPDLSRFANVKHFCSWLGLCPGTKISGGKVLSAKPSARPTVPVKLPDSPR